MANIQSPSSLKLSVIQWPLSYLSYPPPVICSPDWGVPAHTAMLHAEAILEPFPALVHPPHRRDTAHLRWGRATQRDIAIPCFVVCSFWTNPHISPVFLTAAEHCVNVFCQHLKTLILPQLSNTKQVVCFLFAVWHLPFTLCLICHFIIRSLTSVLHCWCLSLLRLLSKSCISSLISPFSSIFLNMLEGWWPLSTVITYQLCPTSLCLF